MRKHQTTTGIILNLFPLRNAHQIITLFTLDFGLIKVVCYGSQSLKSKWHSLCKALSEVEIVFVDKGTELFDCSDLSLVNAYENLRGDFNFLNIACDMLYCLNLSQLLEKPAPKLYALLVYYLRKIDQIKDPWRLSLSFRLKLLYHDGLLCVPFICQQCSQLIYTEAYFFDGVANCQHHHLFPDAIFFDAEELLAIYSLATVKSYVDLEKIYLPAQIKNKIFALFKDCLNHG